MMKRTGLGTTAEVGQAPPPRWRRMLARGLSLCDFSRRNALQGTRASACFFAVVLP